MTPRNWKRLQPTSLRHALELCKDHARARHNRSVEGIAELMGLADHWALYKWLQNGRMPANLIRPYEAACGIDFVTRWVAASSGQLLVPMPKGKAANQGELVELNTCFAATLQLLTDFYADPAQGDPEATLASLTHHLQQVASHRANVAQFSTPQLDFE